MKRSKLLIAALVLLIISFLAFCLYLSMYSTLAGIIKEANSGESEGSEAVGQAFGSLILIVIVAGVGIANLVLSGISLGLSVAALIKRKVIGKMGMSITLVVINAVIILTVIILFFGLYLLS